MSSPRRKLHHRPSSATSALLGALCWLGLLAPGAPPAFAAGGDVSATSTYLQADYALVHAGTSKISQVQAALQGLLSRVRRECPLAAAGSPQDPQSTQLSDELIGAMVTAVVHLDLPEDRSFIRAASQLSWSNRRLTAQIHQYVADVKILIGLPEPNLCADIRAWAASGFHTLAPSTISFAPRFIAAWVRLGDLPNAMARYAAPGDRSLFARTRQLEERFTDIESREVETYGSIMNALDLSP